MALLAIFMLVPHLGGTAYAQQLREVKITVKDNAGGSDHKVRFDYAIRSSANDRVVNVDTWEYTMDGGSKTATLSCSSGSYISEIHVQIRCKSGSWKNHEIGIIKVPSSSMTFVLGGSTKTKVYTTSSPSGYAISNNLETGAWIADMKNNKYAVPKNAPTTRVNTSSSSNTSRPTTSTTSSTSTAAAKITTHNYASMERKAGIRQALADIRVLEGPSAMVRNVQEAPSPQYIIDGGDLYELKTREIDVKNQASTDLFCNEGTQLFPGCLVYANSKLRDGNGTPTNDFGVGRVVVTLDIDTGGQNSITTGNSRGEIETAVRTLVRQAYSSGYHQPARAGYLKQNYNSKEQMSIDLGCDINYAGAKLKSDNSTKSTASKITHFEDLSLIYYTVHVDPVDNDPANLFGPNVTGQQIVDLCKKNGPITYVGSMNYGARIYLFEDYEAHDFTFNGSQNASYQGSSVTSKQDIVKNTSASNKRVFIWGGPVSLGTGMIENESQVQNVITQVQKNTGFNISSQNQGLPIGLTCLYASSGDICSRVTNGKYTEISYVKHPRNVHLKVNMDVTAVAGGRCKPKFMYQTLIIDPNKVDPKTGERGVIVRRNVTHEMIEKDYSGNGSSIDKVFTKELILEPNEFIDGNIYFGVRTKAYSNSNYTQAIEGFVDPIKYNGSIEFIIRGDTRGQTYIHSSSPCALINQTNGKR